MDSARTAWQAAAVRKIDSIPVWAFVAAGWGAAFLPLRLAGRGGLWPPALPAQPAGVDLAMMLDYARAWLETGNPFLGMNPYPPLAAVLFAPLAALPFALARGIVAALTLAAFVSVVAVLPPLAFPRADRAAVLLAALGGALSYGLWFELRWGQFNVLALAATAWGFSCSTAGADAARGGRRTGCSRRASSSNCIPRSACFCSRGTRGRGGRTCGAGRGWARRTSRCCLRWARTCSRISCMRCGRSGSAVRLGGQPFDPKLCVWSGRPETAPVLFAAFAACLAAALGRAARRPGRAAFMDLALACALGTMLLPGVSHDYKLVALPLAFAPFVAAAEPLAARGVRGGLAAGAFLALCGLEAWTLFSLAAKPTGLQNSAPFLLAACGLLAFRPRPRQASPSGHF